MNDIEKKLQVLTDIAHGFNQDKVLWAVGASLLLYFKGISDTFHDIDIMVGEADIEKVKARLLGMGQLALPNPNMQYKTRHFLEFTIKGIDVDIMAGFVIVKDGNEYDCALLPEQIAESIQLNGESIPLHSLQLWRHYYALMGRTSKVEMIDRETH